jgi:hypothetical protein
MTSQKIATATTVFEQTPAQDSKPELTVAQAVPYPQDRLFAQAADSIIQAGIDLPGRCDIHDRPRGNAEEIARLQSVLIVTHERGNG